jgi:hypothetical protein
MTALPAALFLAAAALSRNENPCARLSSTMQQRSIIPRSMLSLLLVLQYGMSAP